MAKKKAAKKSAKSSGGAKKASRKGAKKKGGRSKSMMGQMGDMMESAGKGIASAAKYVAPKGMMGKGKKKAKKKK